MKLSKYLKEAISAYSNISFSPEERGKSNIECYSRMLEHDLEKLQATGKLGENNNYEEKFINHWLHWINAKSRCFSVMITGGSNFNSARHDKVNNWEMNAYNKFMDWRDKYYKAVNREPIPTPYEAIVKYSEQLETIKILNENLRKAKLDLTKCKSKLKYIEDIKKMMVNLGYSNEIVSNIKINFKNKIIIALRKNPEENELINKIEVRKQRIKLQDLFKLYEDDNCIIECKDWRIRIKHNEKPSLEITKELRKNGFKWSPHYKCWLRQITMRSIYVMTRLSFIEPEIMNISMKEIRKYLK